MDVISAENDKMLKTVEAYIAQVDSLLNKTYKEGKDEEEELFNRIIYFMLSSFPDGKERFNRLVQKFPPKVGFKGTEEDNQSYYIAYLKAMRENLVANKEELQARTSKEKIVNEPVLIIKEEPVQIEKQDILADQIQTQPVDSQETPQTQQNLESDQKLYCRYCGSTLPSDSLFCEKCGKKLK